MQKRQKMINISGVSPNDDFLQIIKLIYLTDDYIYPEMCGNDYEYFEELMLYLLNTDSIFSHKNISLAKFDGKIIGLALAFTNNQKIPSFSQDIKFEVRDCYKMVMDIYFNKILDELQPDFVYVNNLIVDHENRKSGVGYALIRYVQKIAGKKKIVLDCLEDNASAIALYKKCGFIVTDKFEGFSGDADSPVLCLRLETMGNDNC